jgi:ubiquinone/menaquinone biosynthesis C-methylase UbiE
VDVVISNGALNLAPDKVKVLKEIHRVLKTGGRLYLACAVPRRRLPSGCKSHPATSLRPEAIGAVMEVTKWLKPLM